MKYINCFFIAFYYEPVVEEIINLAVEEHMENNIIIQDAITSEEITLFWEKRNVYMREDIIPNCTFGDPITKEEEDWFFSKEYMEHIMGLYFREINKLYLIFFEKDGVRIGFSNYITYHSEDGKCFIVDFCIDIKFRNQGLGRECFHLIESREVHNGATYFALNLSNEKNERFWKSLGFVKNGNDEYNNPIYIYRPKT